MRLAYILAVMSIGATQAQDVIVWREQIDTRPFLVRLALSVGMAFEVGARKAKLRVERDKAEVSGGTKDGEIRRRDLIPKSYAASLTFGADF
jgi:hypothetical protein